MQTLTLTLAANQTVAFDISGSYFEIIDSVGLVSVNFYDASGSRTKDLELLRVLSGFFVKGRFSRFEISDSSGLAQTITVLYGSTEGGTRRSPGNVRVIDQSYDQTFSKNQFIAGNGSQNSNYGVLIGLAATTKQITVKALKFASNSTSGLEIVRGTGLPLNNYSAGPAPTNKYINGPSSVNLMCAGTVGSSGFPLQNSDLANVAVVTYVTPQAGGLQDLALRTPLIIPVGSFFGFASSAANVSVQVIAEIEE